MSKRYLLHLLTPAKNASPFDVNMAYDAGWDAVTPYTQVDPEEVADLVQDTIFSRGPSGVKRTGIFIGGRDMVMAMDMLESAEQSMVPPFVVSVFADPSGAFTTAAAMIAAVENQLQHGFDETLDGQKIIVLGGTGPVGSAASVIAAKAGAEVVMLGREKDKADRVAALCNHAYGADMTGIKGDANDHKAAQLRDATIVLGTAAAGVQVMSDADIAATEQLRVLADLNAVPPAGIAGVGVTDMGEPVASAKGRTLGIGALAIGNIKYQTQHHLLRNMQQTDEPLYLHFEHAFAFARDYLRDA